MRVCIEGEIGLMTGKREKGILKSKTLRTSFKWAPIVHGLVRSSSCIRAIPITCRTKELRRGKGEMRSETSLERRTIMGVEVVKSNNFTSALYQFQLLLGPQDEFQSAYISPAAPRMSFLLI